VGGGAAATHPPSRSAVDRPALSAALLSLFCRAAGRQLSLVLGAVACVADLLEEPRIR
jgi:hypothetical protein